MFESGHGPFNCVLSPELKTLKLNFVNAGIVLYQQPGPAGFPVFFLYSYTKTQGSLALVVGLVLPLIIGY